jgi:hypothetical protein
MLQQQQASSRNTSVNQRYFANRRLVQHPQPLRHSPQNNPDVKPHFKFPDGNKFMGYNCAEWSIQILLLMFIQHLCSKISSLDLEPIRYSFDKGGRKSRLSVI